jgi:ketopantoate reductase
MRVLMVGCGAVGQVFALFLQKAGAELCFFARPASADRLKQALEHGGLLLFQISHFHKRDPIAHRLLLRVVPGIPGSSPL